MSESRNTGSISEGVISVPENNRQLWLENGRFRLHLDDRKIAACHYTYGSILYTLQLMIYVQNPIDANYSTVIFTVRTRSKTLYHNSRTNLDWATGVLSIGIRNTVPVLLIRSVFIRSDFIRVRSRLPPQSPEGRQESWLYKINKISGNEASIPE
jgi:hypothetical protein